MGVSRALRSGVVWVNTILDVAPQMPFGGVKQLRASAASSDIAGLDEFTELKSIYLTTGPRTPEFAGRPQRIGG